MAEKVVHDAAMNAFKKEKWGEVENFLLKINSDTAHYYLGVINNKQHDYKRSIECFLKLKLVLSGLSNVNIDSHWFI
jgi:hypothetical protein